MSHSDCTEQLELSRSLGTHIELTAEKCERLASFCQREFKDQTAEQVILDIMSIACQHGEVEITSIRWEV